MTAIHASAPIRQASGPSDNRRIGRREPMSDLLIDWQPPVAKEASRFRRRRGQVGQAATAEVLDLSLSGAKVAVAGADLLPVGTTVRIARHGAAGIAIVRRVVDDPGGRSIYGIQFLVLDPALGRQVSSLLTGRRAHLEERWRRAR